MNVEVDGDSLFVTLGDGTVVNAGSLFQGSGQNLWEYRAKNSGWANSWSTVGDSIDLKAGATYLVFIGAGNNYSNSAGATCSYTYNTRVANFTGQAFVNREKVSAGDLHQNTHYYKDNVTSLPIISGQTTKYWYTISLFSNIDQKVAFQVSKNSCAASNGPDARFMITRTSSQGGATGPSGADGTNGVDGATGATGPSGADGTNGATGAQGPTGAASTVPGPIGPTGTQGPTGAASTVPGPIGPTGPVGVPGDDEL
jgi:hypothetical protein